MRSAIRRVAPLCVASLAIAALTVGTAAAPADAAGAAPTAATTAAGNWVTAWSAAPQGNSTLGSFGAETLSGTVQQQLALKLSPPMSTFSEETLRQVMYLHHAGDALRVRLSNEFGSKPTTFGATSIGKRAGKSGAAVQSGTQRALTFGGKRSVTVPAGRSVLSDPVSLPVKAFDHVVLSMYLPDGNPPATVHGNSMQTFFTAEGNRTVYGSDAAFTEHGVTLNHITSTLTTAEYYATGIQVRSPGAKTLVTLGDSITDGFLSDGNTDTRYPDLLAKRLQAYPGTRHLSVANQAISGGRVTGDGIGPSTLKRLQSNVLDQPNVAGVIFLQGINDLGTAILQDRPKTAAEVIAGYKTLAARLHARHIPVYIGTLTPSGNLAHPAPYGVYSTPTTNLARREVNTWIKRQGHQVFDGVIDFDKAIMNPVVTDWIDPQYDAFDNLHPNSKGYARMAASIPSSILLKIARR